MTKRILCVIFALAVGFCCCAQNVRSLPAEGAPSVPSAESALLMEASGKTVFYEKNAHTRMGPASTTKIMTALVAMSHADADQIITVSADAVGVEGSSVYLIAGEKLTLRELLYALLLSSANDAAVAIAIGLAGSVETFCDWMNQKATDMGLCDTHFVNPHGLYDEDHYTTAYELARIAAEALSYPLLREIVSTYKMTIPHNGTPGARLLVNHNKLLRTYEGAIGMKTGFTKKTGRTLVSAAEREGLTLIAVTLNDPDDWREHTAMLDWGFANYRAVSFAEAGEFRYTVPVTGGCEEEVTVTNTQPLSLILPRTYDTPTVRVEGTARFLFAPVEAGTHFGTVTLEANGRSVSSPLYLASSVATKPPEKKGLFSRLFGS